MRFAVLMRKQNVNNPWITFQWAPQEVFPDFGQFASPVNQSNQITGQFLDCDSEGESWLFTGFELNLFPDEAEGYYLNISSARPCWFVMWRLEDDINRYVDSQSIDRSQSGLQFAVPHRICVSYNEAARLLDGGESVDSVLLSDEHATWLQEYVNEHYHPEAKKRHRPESFKGAERPGDI